MQTDEFKQEMRRRNGIEGTQSELVRAYGLRRARYRGQAKVRLQNYLIGAACSAGSSGNLPKPAPKPPPWPDRRSQKPTQPQRTV
jgi:hypothetical protein